MQLYRGEALCLMIMGTLALVMVLLARQSPSEVVWPTFTRGFVLYGALMAFGLLLRARQCLPRLSITLIALGFFPIYTSLLVLTSYLMFPFERPLIDPLLFAIDARMGYDWVAAVTWLSNHPEFSRLLLTIYVSSIPQLAILLVWLGMTGRIVQLHRMIVTGMLAGCLVVAIWAVFPSLGPAAYRSVPPEVIERAGLLVTPDYGAQLLALAVHGTERIDQHQLLGTVAFPSFHMVMALMAACFAVRTWLFWPLAMLSVLSVPATLTHGGHHLIDILGGTAIFALTLVFVCRLLPMVARPDPERSRSRLMPGFAPMPVVLRLRR